jgi:hypothetical protein
MLPIALAPLASCIFPGPGKHTWPARSSTVPQLHSGLPPPCNPLFFPDMRNPMEMRMWQSLHRRSEGSASSRGTARIQKIAADVKGRLATCQARHFPRENRDTDPCIRAGPIDPTRKGRSFHRMVHREAYTMGTRKREPVRGISQ